MGEAQAPSVPIPQRADPSRLRTPRVRNIVLSQRAEFRRLYSGLLQSLGTVSVHENRPNRFAMRQDLSPTTRAGYAARLPLRLRERLVDYYAARPELDEAFAAVSLSKGEPSIKRRPSRGEMAGDPGAVKSNSGEEKGEGDKVKEDARRMSAFWLAAVQREDFHDVLLQQIAATVKGPAWTQSLKGVYTAGVGRTLKYVAAKVGKWFEGRRSTGGEKGKEEGEGESEKK